MDQKAYLAVVGMLNSFPASNSNPDLTMGTYEQVLQGLSPQAVTEAAQRFTMGDVQGQSKTFAPSIAEFVTEARQRQEYIDLKDKPRLQHFYHHTGTPFHIRQEKRRTKYQDYPVIAENINFDQWRRLSQSKEVPVGAFWVAALGTVYGPPAMEIAKKA